MNSNNLLNTCNQSKYCDKVLERTWQYELQKAIEECLPNDIFVSSEVGKMFGNDGIVDLYIQKYRWAIELLIDGDNLKKHHDRFTKGNNNNLFFKINLIFLNIILYNIFKYIDGKYWCIPISSYMIIDIRQTKKLKKIYPNTWHIIPNNNFTRFEVVTKNEYLITENFTIFTINKDNIYCKDLDNIKNKMNIFIILLVILILLIFVLAVIILFSK